MSSTNLAILRGLRIGEDEENGPKSADTVYRISLLLCVLFTLLYVIELPILAVFPANLGVINKLSWNIAPSFAIALTVVSVVLGFIVNPIGVVALVRASRFWALVFFYGCFLLVTFQLVTFIILLLRGNSIVAVNRLDINSNEIDPEDQEVDSDTLADITQEEVVQFSLDFPEEWKDIQDELKCCGFNVRTLYSDQVFSFEDFEEETFSSGSLCTSGREEINILFLEQPSFSVEALQFVENEGNFNFITANNFFCEAEIAENVKNIAQTTSILFGVQVFFQVVLMFTMGLLIYSYQEKNGGLRANEADLTLRPQIQNTILAKAGYNPEQLATKSQSTASQGRRSVERAGTQKVRF